MLYIYIQPYVGDITGLVPNHHNKVNITIEQVTPIFWFLSTYESQVYM